MHIFDLIFPEQVCLFPNIFPKKIFLGRYLLLLFPLPHRGSHRAGKHGKSQDLKNCVEIFPKMWSPRSMCSLCVGGRGGVIELTDEVTFRLSI